MSRLLVTHESIIQEDKLMRENYWMKHKKPTVNFKDGKIVAIERQLEDQRELIAFNRNPQLHKIVCGEPVRSKTMSKKSGAINATKLKCHVISKIVRDATGDNKYALLSSTAPLPQKSAEPVAVDPEFYPLLRPYLKASKEKPVMVSYGHRPRSASRVFHPATMKFHLKHNEIADIGSSMKTGFGLSATALSQLLKAPEIIPPPVATSDAIIGHTASLLEDFDRSIVMGNRLEESTFSPRTTKKSLTKRTLPKLKKEKDRQVWIENFNINQKPIRRISAVTNLPVPIRERFKRFNKLAAAEPSNPLCASRQLNDKRELAGEKVLPIPSKSDFSDPSRSLVNDAMQRKIAHDAILDRKISKQKQTASVLSIPYCDYHPFDVVRRDRLRAKSPQSQSQVEGLSDDSIYKTAISNSLQIILDSSFSKQRHTEVLQKALNGDNKILFNYFISGNAKRLQAPPIDASAPSSPEPHDGFGFGGDIIGDGDSIEGSRVEIADWGVGWANDGEWDFDRRSPRENSKTGSRRSGRNSRAGSSRGVTTMRYSPSSTRGVAPSEVSDLVFSSRDGSRNDSRGVGSSETRLKKHASVNLLSPYGSRRNISTSESYRSAPDSSRNLSSRASSRETSRTQSRAGSTQPPPVDSPTTSREVSGSRSSSRGVVAFTSDTDESSRVVDYASGKRVALSASGEISDAYVTVDAHSSTIRMELVADYLQSNTSTFGDELNPFNSADEVLQKADPMGKGTFNDSLELGTYVDASPQQSADRIIVYSALPPSKTVEYGVEQATSTAEAEDGIAYEDGQEIGDDVDPTEDEFGKWNVQENNEGDVPAESADGFYDHGFDSKEIVNGGASMWGHPDDSVGIGRDDFVAGFYSTQKDEGSWAEGWVGYGEQDWGDLADSQYGGNIQSEFNESAYFAGGEQLGCTIGGEGVEGGYDQWDDSNYTANTHDDRKELVGHLEEGRGYGSDDAFNSYWYENTDHEHSHDPADGGDHNYPEMNHDGLASTWAGSDLKVGAATPLASHPNDDAAGYDLL